MTAAEIKKPPRSLCNKLRGGWKQTRLLNGIPLCNRVRHLARILTPMLTIPHISAAVNEISHRKEDALLGIEGTSRTLRADPRTGGKETECGLVLCDALGAGRLATGTEVPQEAGKDVRRDGGRTV